MLFRVFWWRREDVGDGFVSCVALCVTSGKRIVWELSLRQNDFSRVEFPRTRGEILKCAQDDDTVTLKAGEQKDLLTLMFENKAQGKIMDFGINLMEIGEETLGISEQKYQARVEMIAAEFAKTIRDL